jgi:hypothetical protein
MSTIKLARRLAGPSFSLNVRYDQGYMTKRRTKSSQDIGISKNVRTDFTSEYEVFDVAEGEILVSKDQPGRLSDGYARCFSSVNGWQGALSDKKLGPDGKPVTVNGKTTPADEEDKRRELCSKVKFIGVAVTPHRTAKIQKFDQGFVAIVSGVITVVNESGETLHPGTPLTFDVCKEYPKQHGIHSKKIRFCFRKAKGDEKVVAKALSYSQKTNSTVDILLHPQRHL